METFDIVILGAGPAGVSAALRGADQGARVCIIEQKNIGGSCLRRGLYPLKCALGLLKNNELSSTLNDVIDVGLLSRSVTESMESVSEKWKERLTEFEVTMVMGGGTPFSSEIVQVETKDRTFDIGAKKIILATGSHPIALPILPFEEDIIVSADDVFKGNVIPEAVFIMGGDGSGCELAIFYQLLGSKVFLGDYEPRLLCGQDPEIVDILEKSLKKLKVKLLLGKKLSSYFKNNGLLDITLSGGVKFQVEKIVQNMFRHGNSENLGCDTLGIRLGENKEILVNEKLETSVAGIFAVGSVTGRKSRPGVSEEEGRIAADNAMGKNKSINSDWIPFIVYTEPEIASVGCFAEEAHHKGFRGIEGNTKFRNLDFSSLNSNVDGLFKIVADAKSGMVIGGQIISPNASQLISLVVMAIRNGMKVGALASLAGEKSGEIEGIREAARLCRKALKRQLKSP